MFVCACLCVWLCTHIIIYVYVLRDIALKTLLHMQSDDADVLLGPSAICIYIYLCLCVFACVCVYEHICIYIYHNIYIYIYISIFCEL